MSQPDLHGPVLEVAPRLLGSVLWTDFEGRTSVRLTEVEAYGGTDDPASHAFRGPTPRNASMFKSAGTLYVYRSYGIHWCMNVVTGEPDHGQAVLLRGGEIIEGAELIRRRRGRVDRLTDGPGKLTQALGVTGAHDGGQVLTGPVHLERGSVRDRETIVTTPRIGISQAADRPWRFVLQQY